MRRKQFLQLQAQLKAELGRNNDSGVRASDLSSIQQTINRVYETLWDEFDWSFLTVYSTRASLSAGQYQYSFPANIDIERIEEVVVWYNGKALPLTRGIDFEQYSIYDSESDERSDPALRWDVRYGASADVLEIWPIPASDDYEYQVRGRQKFTELVDDSDVCLLDASLVVLFAAYELAPKDLAIQRKKEAAERRLHRLKTRTQKPVRFNLAAGGRRGEDRAPTVQVVVPS